MIIDLVKNYLTSTVKTPYFLFISDEQYSSAIEELRLCGLNFVPMSDFCSSSDKIPDVDGLFSYIEAADVNVKGKKFVVTGLGEFLALRGVDEAKRTLSRLKDLNIGGAKVVLLLRGLYSLIAGLETDPRFDSRRFSVVDRGECDLSFTLVAPSVGLSVLTGFKAILSKLEEGRCGRIIANTEINFDKAILSVDQINNAYDGLRLGAMEFALARSCGTDSQWAELLIELNQSSGSLDAVFEKHGFDRNLESNFYSRAAGENYDNWLYFICLKSKIDILRNGYLRFVLDKTNRFEEFVSNVLNAIIEIPHTDKRFTVFYKERKELVEKFPESDIADFVVNSRQVVAESIYKLTDRTKTEREEIVAWLSNNGLIPELENIYPVLAAYMKKYAFKCPELADLLTDYFDAYKRQKLSNQLEPEFLEKVDELAISRPFSGLPTREMIMDSIDKNETYLYWLDALGVEYLGLIEALVQKKGLAVHISIARAELPTITSINRGFFDSWKGGKKEKNAELDDTKHHDVGGYNFTDNELPIHLARELDIITAMIDKAATELALRHCKRFLIVSDHGASRLAVLRRKEEKYDTDTSGEHSGRCCKLFHPNDLPFAADENGYLVLADYGRFKGSRAANVEVHGGASLEEVVIPVIELSLKNSNVTVKLVDETVTADFRAGAEIKLFFNSPVQKISVVLDGKPYQAVQTGDNHYFVKLPDTKRAGEYPADVYAGDNLIGKILIKTQGKSGKVNDAFDDLF
ncbi:BREX-4 system phosphatase PglZ [Synergistaceae bacterium OttesenSCG-928-I11]|nr:BREX-4 system phosphatase PglZ [Synergistaceae bacterium OttesenSCG-928-I11]